MIITMYDVKLKPIKYSHTISKFQHAVLKVIETQSRKHLRLIERIATLWWKDQEHDHQINLQRIIYILRLFPSLRSSEQVQFLQSEFEGRFDYIQSIKKRLDESNFTYIFHEMHHEYCHKFDLLFQQGQTGRKMYFILSGEVAILLPTGRPQSPRKYNKGSIEDLVQTHFPDFRLATIKKTNAHFGEIAIEQRVPRTASVLANTDCHFAVLTYECYQKILGNYQDSIMNQKLNRLLQFPIFQSWPKSGQFILLHSCQEVQFPGNTIIYARGQQSSSVYMVLSGEIQLSQWNSIEKYQNVERELQDALHVGRQRKQVVGIYSQGQVVGDFELWQTNYTKNVVMRRTEAKATQDTLVFQVPIVQYLDAFRMFASIDQLRQVKENEFKIMKRYREQEIEERDANKLKIDLCGITKQFYKSNLIKKQLREHQASLSQQNTFLNKKELSSKLKQINNYENELQQSYSQRFSFAIPFRNDPLNSQVELISTKTFKNGKGEKRIMSGRGWFSPSTETIQSIIYPEKKKQQTEQRKESTGKKSRSEHLLESIRKKEESWSHRRSETQFSRSIFENQVVSMVVKSKVERREKEKEGRRKERKIEYKYEMKF